MKKMILATLTAAVLTLTGCSNVHYDHVTIVACDTMGLDVRLQDGAIRHYDVWNFSMPSCSLVPKDTDVSLYLQHDPGDMAYHFGWVRKN